MKRIFFVALAFTMVLLFSCKTYNFFTINVLEPAEIALPAEYKKVVIVHNLYRSASDTTGTVYKLFDEIKTDTNYLYDKIAAEAIFSLQDFLNGSERFEAVIYDSSIYRFPKFSDDFTLTDLDVIRQICHQNEADAFILLTGLSSVDHYDVMTDRWGSYFGEFEVEVKTSWLFIDPFKSKLIDSKNMKTTQYFQTDPWYFNENIQEFLLRKDVLLKSGTEVGLSYGRRISPYWSQTERLVFKNGCREIRKGYKESQLGNWETAAEYWQKALENAQTLNQAKASFNLGVAAEMDGSLEPAIDWVEKSMELFPDTLNKIYLQILQKRLEQQDDIYFQMEGLQQ